MGPLRVLWLSAAAGWVAVCAGLWRGLTGTARKATLTAHGLTLGAVPTLGSTLGFGLLHLIVASTALWWSLLAVTGFRPERLVDPGGDASRRLLVWLVLGGAVTWLAHRAVF